MAVSRLQELMEVDREDNNKDYSIKHFSLSDDITFNHVTFSYGSRPPVIKNIDLKIKKGEKMRCNLCEEENKVVWQSEWDSYELLLGNYSDGKVDGTLRPYECKVMRSI
mgnify:CR=1 FL=1